MLARYFGPGLLGLGITALIAGFMSGMAGNVTAFSTVWTYDIYRSLIRRDATDQHYVWMGRWCTILGVLVSIGTAYLVMQFLSIMDYVQALFSFFIAPLFGTVLLGMLWKRATPAGGFWGLLVGTLSSIAMWAWVKLDPSALSIIALSPNAKDMAENMYRGLWSWLICVVVTVVVSLATRPLPEKQLEGLVYGCTRDPLRGSHAAPSASGVLGGDCGRGVCGPEYLVLVTAMARHGTISIWFFIGLLILIYGVLILGAGIAGLSSPPPVVMAQLHVAIWWGAFLIVIGAVYVYLFRPGEQAMSVVAGVDFGTLSVRVSIVDSNCGRIGSGVAEYPLHRRREDPDYATQSHTDHMGALAEATKRAVAAAGVEGEDIRAIALDTTGSSVIPVGERSRAVG